ncbi:AfsA-related hotdog domain-containing protein [Streptomyces sp. LHD-70]|uniref:AfsA-related hotdog domain-containing protein n=1 Tax=Streptomyces sp. LHD-70 TaxID=3072140 RepID=UPI00280C7DA2|nr:AfsA-related hotdog domain-containing protein [Streptomyces sp. LHD-70]MDQ8708124.1 AfsA-related hotdog domain-containing protein [Streptomyces sp. LHD-70]
MSSAATSRLVVGDRFRDFAEAVGADTFSGLTRSLDAGDLDTLDGPVHVVTGQGIGEFEISYLRDSITRRQLDGRIVVVHSSGQPAHRQELHKAREDNVLVAALTQLDDSTYEAQLRLHDHNELLVDVQDRVHVQGMVAVEAARQMFLAVVERYFTARWPQQRYYIVLNSMNTTFSNFLFPVGATLRLKVDESDLSEPGRLTVRTTVEVQQAGRAAAEVTIDAAAFAPGFLEEKELRRAKSAVASAVDAALTTV